MGKWGKGKVGEASWRDEIESAAAAVRAWCRRVPDTAVVLGSGLGDFVESLSDAVSVAYDELPHWPRSTVAGHAGRLVVGTVSGRRVAVLCGRAHLYEGHDSAAVVRPIRVMARLGVRQIVLTNAAGGISPTLRAGMLMVIDDHINLQPNPLVGPNEDRLGPRFPDMSEVYSGRLRAVADEAAVAVGLAVAHGVYAGVVGPSYETPAEIRALRILGADAVGMSTVAEAVSARHMGLDVLGLSCITNMAAGIDARPITHDDVLDTAGRAGADLASLLGETLGRL